MTLWELQAEARRAMERSPRRRRDVVGGARDAGGGARDVGGGASDDDSLHKPQQRHAANARERSRMRVLSKAFSRLKVRLIS